MRCTASSVPTARASPPQFASCSACSGASEGSALVLGGDPWTDPATLHRRIAYVPSEVTLWPQLTGGEVIDLLGRLRGETDPARRAEMLQRFELDPTMRSTAYSRGNRQKVPLVAALASDARSRCSS